MLQEYTCGDKSADILKEYLNDKRSATLPRNVIIKDESNRVNCLLSDSTLKPAGFSFSTGPYDFFVTGRTQSSATLRGLSPSGSTNHMQDCSDTEDEIFFQGSQFGDIPHDPRANDDTVSFNSVSQSSVSQPSSVNNNPSVPHDQSDTEDEIFFGGSQFGGIPPDPRANDDTVSLHSDLSHQASVPQPASIQTGPQQSQVPQLSSSQSNTPQSQVSTDSSIIRSTFQSVLPENTLPGLDGLGKLKMINNK